ncbi:MAG: hypothetical protein ACRERD_00255, partial [Candidatus Binatia bacterium]
MNHPFRWLPRRFWWIVLVILATVTLIVSGILACQGAALRTDEAPRGLFSLQLAWTSKCAHKVIDSWKASQVLQAYSQLFLDVLFLCLYPALFSLSCVMLSTFLANPLARIGLL